VDTNRYLDVNHLAKATTWAYGFMSACPGWARDTVVGARTCKTPYYARNAASAQGMAPKRADMVTKSRAHQGSKNVPGPCTVAESSLLPLDGAARPPGLEGS